MISNNNYESLISRILNGSSKLNDINDFVNLCCSISAAYLKNELYFNRIYFPIFKENNEELKDISLDLIAPLFARDNNNKFHLINRYLNSNSSQLVEESLFTKLKRLIISKTKQELIEQFKNVEPGGYKILRNIKLAPSRDNNIQKYTKGFCTYLYYSTAEKQDLYLDKLNVSLPELDSDELLELVRGVCKNNSIMPVMIENILIAIKNNRNCSDCIEISALFKAFRSILLADMIPLENINEQNRISGNIYADEYHFTIIHILEKFISATVKSKYLDKVKINKSTAINYEKILKEYFYDIVFSNKTKPLPHYINGYNHRNNGNSYISDDKIRLTYLVKVTKNKLFNIISKL